MRKLCLVLALQLMGSTALAGDPQEPGKKPDAKAGVAVKLKLAMTLDDLLALTELPRDMDAAIKAGSSEEELDKTIKNLKEKKVEGKAASDIAKHFKKQAEERNSDQGLSDVVHGCMELGMKGTKLVACVHKDWNKKPKVKKDDQGKPEDKGKAELQGRVEPEMRGNTEDKGKPEGKGQPEAKAQGKPEGKGQPEAKAQGKPEGKGQPEAKAQGKPEGKGQPEAKAQGKPEGKGKDGK
jgi:hypothetical protein